MQSSEAAVEQKGREERGGVGEARWQGLVMRRWAASVDLVVSRRGLDGDSGDPVRFATGLSLRLENALSRHVPRVFPERLSARSSFLRAVSSDWLVPRPRPALITRPPPALVVISVLVADPLFPPSSSSSSTAARHPSSGPLCFLPRLALLWVLSNPPTPPPCSADLSRA